MVPDEWVWAGIIAAVLSLVALQPIVYRFLAEQFWPYGVKFTFHEQYAQAGSGVVLNIAIRNRTNDPAYFQIGALYSEDPASDIRSFRFIHITTYRHVPLNELFSGHLALGPLELDSVVVRFTPTVRGHFRFLVEITEFTHWSRFPRWVSFNRRVLKRTNVDMHRLAYQQEIDFIASTWSTAPDQLRNVIGRDQTPEELALDMTYGWLLEQAPRPRIESE